MEFSFLSTFYIISEGPVKDFRVRFEPVWEARMQPLC